MGGIRAWKRGGGKTNNSGAYINPDMEAGEASKCPQTSEEIVYKAKNEQSHKKQAGSLGG